jgi:hypothetical protein
MNEVTAIELAPQGLKPLLRRRGYVGAEAPTP